MPSRVVTAGSQIPVYRICVGTGDKQVKLKDLRKTIVKQKAYVPSGHKNKLIAKIHPRSRFLLTQRELDILNDRLRTLQTKQGMGNPEGHRPDPPAAHQPSRDAWPLTAAGLGTSGI